MRYFKSIFLALLIAVSLIASVAAHEVGLSAVIRARTASGEANYTAENLPSRARVTAIDVVAVYSTGDPMTGATVEIYAPGESSTPWRTGTLDNQGRYRFTPNSQRGRWTIRVEGSGHSSFMNLVL
ncbi:MAG: carboxypeptidase regulatory-like domain-containing protein [Leptolyngbyaceae cyanobacterium SL_7_1]|nr:carboxypeptidase regulatory-like domain-containing protein [Leptolyngbyaceae cyanobacterium SL_7_1]